MRKCSCYHEEEIRKFYPFDFEPLTTTVGHCYGTKERDICDCGGDEAKCDFYPEKREKAAAEFSKMCDMNAKELLDYVIDEVAKRRNINAMMSFTEPGTLWISIYPYEEDEDEL